MAIPLQVRILPPRSSPFRVMNIHRAYGDIQKSAPRSLIGTYDRNDGKQKWDCRYVGMLRVSEHIAVRLLQQSVAKRRSR